MMTQETANTIARNWISGSQIKASMGLSKVTQMDPQKAREYLLRFALGFSVETVVSQLIFDFGLTDNDVLASSDIPTEPNATPKVHNIFSDRSPTKEKE